MNLGKIINFWSKQKITVLSVGHEDYHEHELESHDIRSTSGKISEIFNAILFDSIIHLARVALSWFMVLLKEMYLNSLSQAQNTLIARMLVEVSCQKLKVSKSPNV